MLWRRKNAKNISDLYGSSNENSSDSNMIVSLRKSVRRLIIVKHSDIKWRVEDDDREEEKELNDCLQQRNA